MIKSLIKINQLVFNTNSIHFFNAFNQINKSNQVVILIKSNDLIKCNLQSIKSNAVDNCNEYISIATHHLYKSISNNHLYISITTIYRYISIYTNRLLLGIK